MMKKNENYAPEYCRRKETIVKEETMKIKLIILIIAVSLLAMALTGRPNAAGISTGNKDNGLIAASGKPAQENKKTNEAGEGKADEEVIKGARKAEEEAKKIIVARVNGTDINMFMLIRAMNRVAAKYVKEGEAASAEVTGRIKKEALERLIFEELAVQEAIRQDINPSHEAIEKVLVEVRKNLGSEEAYRAYLDKNNLTENELNKMIERSQRLELITAREVYGKVKVDEKLLREEYEREKGRYILPDNFVVEDVWFLKGKEDAAQKHAYEILNLVKKDDNDPNKLVLDDSFIVRRMNIKKEKYPEIYKSVTQMRAGDLSGVIKEEDGFHIIKVVKEELSRQVTFEEARKSIEPKFLYPAQEQRRQQWQNGLLANARVEIIPEKIGDNLKPAETN